MPGFLRSSPIPISTHSRQTVFFGFSVGGTKRIANRTHRRFDEEILKYNFLCFPFAINFHVTSDTIRLQLTVVVKILGPRNEVYRSKKKKFTRNMEIY